MHVCVHFLPVLVCAACLVGLHWEKGSKIFFFSFSFRFSPTLHTPINFRALLILLQFLRMLLFFA